jgi:hypothetical protein
VFDYEIGNGVIQLRTPLATIEELTAVCEIVATLDLNDIKMGSLFRKNNDLSSD